MNIPIKAIFIRRIFTMSPISHILFDGNYIDNFSGKWDNLPPKVQEYWGKIAELLECGITVLENNEFVNKLLEESKTHPPANQCTILECMICGVRDCPEHEPLHYDKDGCPCRH